MIRMENTSLIIRLNTKAFTVFLSALDFMSLLNEMIFNLNVY